MSHFIEYCVCGAILNQCRCPSPDKTKHTRAGPCQCSKPGPTPATSPHRVTESGNPPAPGMEHEAAPQPIRPDGQYGDYYVLDPESREKKRVRPLRRSYKHVGVRPKHPLRDLTADEAQRYAAQHYIKFEAYPEHPSGVTGRFWTQAQLDSGCRNVTSMGGAIAETYACDPKFYRATFCASCRAHLPVEEFVWVDDQGRETTDVVGS